MEGLAIQFSLKKLSDTKYFLNWAVFETEIRCLCAGGINVKISEKYDNKASHQLQLTTSCETTGFCTCYYCMEQF